MKKTNIANLPTRNQKLNNISKEVNKNVYVKRDDETGYEISGNKVRKMEYIVTEALNMKVDTLITCGGLQSNHARCVAYVATKFGMKSILVLADDSEREIEGNHFFDHLVGAEIKYVANEEYGMNRERIMNEIADDLAKQGRKAMVIPAGASNSLGGLGYLNCYEEILEQEKEMGVVFDTIVDTVGSGGTLAGLIYGNIIHGSPKKIVGFNIAATADYYKNNVIPQIVNGMNEYTGKNVNITPDDVVIIDGYTGLGYAKSTKEELQFMQKFTMDEGIVIDPVYTGKCMLGLYNEIKKGTFENSNNILFIHTGGALGWTKEKINMLMGK